MSKPTDKEVMATGEPDGELIYRINLRPCMDMAELLEHHRLARATGETLEQRALRLLREELAAEAAAA